MEKISIVLWKCLKLPEVKQNLMQLTVINKALFIMYCKFRTKIYEKK